MNKLKNNKNNNAGKKVAAQKLFEVSSISISILLLFWIVASWLEVTSQNLDMFTPTSLSVWNLFEIIIK